MRPTLKTELSRRSFIQLTTAATGGLLISLYLDKPAAVHSKLRHQKCIRQTRLYT